MTWDEFVSGMEKMYGFWGKEELSISELRAYIEHFLESKKEEQE